MDWVTLNEFVERISRAQEAHHLFEELLAAATGALDAQQGSVLRYDAEREHLVLEVLKIPPIPVREGIAGKVFRTGQPIRVEDASTDPLCAQLSRPRYKTSSFVSLPIHVRGNCIGVLNLTEKADGPFLESDLQVLQVYTGLIGVAFDRRDFRQEMEALKRMSITDHLTGLRNRRYFEDKLKEEVERSRRFQHSASLIMLDIDDFKIYNDTLGHVQGDDALRITAGCINRSVRSIDLVCRYGGEEFAIVLPQTPVESATIVAERIRREIEHYPYPEEGVLPRGTLSASLGLAAFAADAADPEELLQKADQALYWAKSEGKNRVVVYQSPRQVSQERRRARRLPMRLGVSVEGTDAEGSSFHEETFLNNLSPGGACFPLRRRLDMDATLVLHISPPYRRELLPRDGRIRVAGKVVRLEDHVGAQDVAVAFQESYPMR